MIRSALLPITAALSLAGVGILAWGNQAGADDAQRIKVTDTGSGLVEAAPPQPVIRQWSPPTRSRGQVIKDVLPSSVRIALNVGGKTLRSASGVVLGASESPEGPVGYVITNAHVVDYDASKQPVFEILVDHKGKTTHFPAKVIAMGKVPEADLAILEVPKLELAPVQLVGDGDLELGDDVVVVGAPFGRGLSVSSGIISQLEWDDVGAAREFKTDAPIGYGASGGGIFRVPDGKLVAVVEGYRTAKVSIPISDKSYSFDVPMPGETFAAPAAKIREFLQQKGIAHLFAAQFPKGAETASR